MSCRNIFALLVGINFYFPNRLSNGLYYKNLWGCVQDVQRIEKFLRDRLGLSENQIIKLTSTPDGDAPLEPRQQWPTYSNIVSAFIRLEEMTQVGDQVYVHYSGHGGRARTTKEFQHLKDIDEVLVPMDLGDSEGRYLRDTELQYLLRRLVDKGLFVTVALDSCHAGGQTRGPLIDPEANITSVRGVNGIDYAQRATDSLVAPPAILLENWERLLKNGTRSIESSSGWLLEPKGYVLLPACRASEYANEHPFEGAEKNGALSYWLWDSLKQLGPGLTYKMLHDRILAKVHAQFREQTPQLQGEGNRLVFGCDELLPQHAITVLGVNPDGEVLLNAGQAHDVQPGAKFDVFRLHQTDFRNLTARVALIEVKESASTNSLATVLQQVIPGKIEAGCQAVLVDRGATRLRRRVRLISGDEPDASSEASEALKKVETELKNRADGFIRLVGLDEASDYIVTVQSKDYVVCDAGGFEMLNLKPRLSISDDAASMVLVERLVHIAKYDNVRELDNDRGFTLIHQLDVELMGAQANHKQRGSSRPQLSRTRGGIHSVKDRETVFLRIRNNANEVVNITVFDLQADWAIKQIYPARAAAFETLNPGQQIDLPLQVSLPAGCEHAIDIIKVFATIEPTSFRWFELPALGQRPITVESVPRSGNLEHYFSTLVTNLLARDVSVPVSASPEWATKQFEIQITRAES